MVAVPALPASDFFPAARSPNREWLAMNARRTNSSNRNVPRQTVPGLRAGRRQAASRPVAAHRHRGIGGSGNQPAFFAQELWHESQSRDEIRFLVQSPGAGFIHPVTADEVRERMTLLPKTVVEKIEVVQFSRMTRKRQLFPCYGMQWGNTVYLYPIEESLVETYTRPPTPQQQIEARMYGGRWAEADGEWTLTWTRETLKDFYLNNVLIHEIGHVLDDRNTRTDDRERYANWFAIEYGYRASRGRRIIRSK